MAKTDANESGKVVHKTTEANREFWAHVEQVAEEVGRAAVSSAATLSNIEPLVEEQKND